MKRKTGRKCTVCLLMIFGMTFAAVVGGCGQEAEVKEFTAFFDVPGTEIDDDNVIQEKIAELTGTKCKETWLTGQTLEEAVTYMIASGDYPDFVNGRQQLYEAGALIPLDEYWDNYPNVKNFYSDNEWDAVRQADGHIYWIPQFANGKEEVPELIHGDEAFWIQTRVLKWAGYPEIHTLDEYFELLERYQEANPTMEDGKENIPYTILCEDWRYFSLENPPQFLDGYSNDGSVIVNPETKKVEDYNTTETTRRYFEKLNEEFKRGIIDPESFTQSYDEYITKLANGQVLGMVDQWWNFAYKVNDTLNDETFVEEGCNYVPLPLTIDKGIKNKYHTSAHSVFASESGLAVTVDCKDIKGALSFVNALLEPEMMILRSWGIEGEDYEIDDKGIFYRTDQQRKQIQDQSYVRSRFCYYSYFPIYEGMCEDGINTVKPEFQPKEFYACLPKDVRECLRAYGCKSYVEMLGSNESPGAWYPMYTYSNLLTTATEAGKVWSEMTDVKQEYLPRVVMAEDFETSWEEYQRRYEECRPEIFLEEMQKEVGRRVEKIGKYSNKE